MFGACLHFQQSIDRGSGSETPRDADATAALAGRFRLWASANRLPMRRPWASKLRAFHTHPGAEYFSEAAAMRIALVTLLRPRQQRHREPVVRARTQRADHNEIHQTIRAFRATSLLVQSNLLRRQLKRGVQGVATARPRTRPAVDRTTANGQPPGMRGFGFDSRESFLRVPVQAGWGY
jgi:hypothetical protein